MFVVSHILPFGTTPNGIISETNINSNEVHPNKENRINSDNGFCAFLVNWSESR
jgi:hypothetical protein